MSSDPTEDVRRLMQAQINALGDDELPPGPRWTTEELSRDFEVLGFGAPLVVVRRRSDGQLGSLEFRNHPRLYFNWQAHVK